MQTFLPLPSFPDTMRCLDYRRLGKQRVEAWQILNILDGQAKSNAWQNHPAVKMWRGHQEALRLYLFHSIEEWKRRGYKNTMSAGDINSSKIIYPTWLGNERFHSAHRAALMFKDSLYYSKFGWSEAPKLDYWWPV